jgi:drug/metabolite transporter (DMT)-like permease
MRYCHANGCAYMLYLLLSVCCASGIFVVLKCVHLWCVPSRQTIFFGYVFGVLAGIVNLPSNISLASISLQTSWLPFGISLGILYVVTLLLINGVIKFNGTTTAVIASRLSLAIPVAFSLWIFNHTAGQASLLTYFGLALTMLALLLSTYSKKDTAVERPHRGMSWLPLALFVTAGLLDALTNYTNLNHLTPADTALFSITIFAAAACVSSVLVFIKPKRFQWLSVAFGLALGLVNYFATYFSILALHAFNNNGSLFFPIWNMGVILLSSSLGVLLFKETLNRYRRVGIAISLAAIAILSQTMG